MKTTYVLTSPALSIPLSGEKLSSLLAIAEAFILGGETVTISVAVSK